VDLENAMQIHDHFPQKSFCFLVETREMLEILIASDHKACLIKPPAKSKGFIKYVLNLIKLSRSIQRIVNNYDQIYYPSLLNDVLSGILVNKAKQKKIEIIQYSARYDVLIERGFKNRSKKDTLISQIAAVIFWIITGNPNLVLIKYTYKLTPYFSIQPDYVYDFDDCVKKSSLTKIDLVQPDIRKSLLYLDTGSDVLSYTLGYESKISEIFKLLSKSYDIYIKPHPTHGLFFNLSLNSNVRVINTTEPTSALDFSNFEAVFAMDSIGLVSVHGSQSIALLNMFKFKSQEIKNTYKKYISINDVSNQIVFPETFAEFETLLKNINKST
jgi:hypothetical protein